MDIYVTVNIPANINMAVNSIYFTRYKEHLVIKTNHRLPGTILIIDDTGEEHPLSSKYYTIVDHYNSIDNQEFQYKSIPNYY